LAAAAARDAFRPGFFVAHPAKSAFRRNPVEIQSLHR
jgi:hypothetical protein